MRTHRRPLAVEPLEPREVPAAHFAAAGADPGVIATAQLYDTATGEVRYNVFPFGTAFTGGARVAAADVTGDGVPDLVAVPGAGGGPVVKVFDGVTGAEVRSVLAFDPSFRGGLYVAAADTNLDGKADLVVGAGEGGGPAVAVVDGASGQITRSFFAFDAGFRGGVRVAAADVDGDGRAEVVAAAGPGGGPHVLAFNVAGAAPTVVSSFYALAPNFSGGLTLAAGDLDQDGLAEIVTGAGEGGAPVVGVFRPDGTAVNSFFAADPAQRLGTRVGVVDAGTGYALDIAAVTPTAADTVVGRFTPTGQPVEPAGPGGGWVNGGAEVAPDAALLWNEVARHVIAADGVSAPETARALAMVHAAVFNAVNAIDQKYQAYSFFGAFTPSPADSESAALLAGEQVLSNLFPDRAPEFVAIRDAQLALLPDGDAKTNGLSTGAQSANFINSDRSFDGSQSAATDPFTPGTNPGDWQPTPPDNAPFLLPGWGKVRTFAVGTADNYLPAGPPDLTSQAYATAFDEVKRLGSATSTARTADQAVAAEFWQGGSGTAVDQANQMAEQVVRRENLSLIDSARTLALVNFAVADAGIVAWDAKRTFDRWRPVTAIRAAATDGNAATTADPTWTPLLDTPPTPDDVSATAAFEAAAAAVLADQFGTVYQLHLYSQGLPGVSRAFDGFAHAADEAAASRVYGGVAFRYSADDGLAAGKSIGEYVVANQLKPI